MWRYVRLIAALMVVGATWVSALGDALSPHTQFISIKFWALTGICCFCAWVAWLLLEQIYGFDKEDQETHD